MASDFQSIAVSPNSQTIATIGDSGTHVNFYDAVSLAPVMKLFCPNSNIRKLVFASNGIELFVLTAESRIKVFGLRRGLLNAENAQNALAASNNNNEMLQ